MSDSHQSSTPPVADESIRLQRILSNAGIASRRAAETLILDGRVTVNGKTVTTLGTRANPFRDLVRVDGRIVRSSDARYIILNKPRNVITTAHDERGRRTVLDLLDVRERIYPVGRLDRDTEGLILLTNDGDLANRVMHPRYRLDKEYEVATTSRPSEHALQRLRDGVELDGHLVIPASCRIARQDGSDYVVRLVVHEGVNRMIRRMMKDVDIEIERLKRIRLGPLSVAGLGSGMWRDLRPGELHSLRESVGLDANSKS